jgi:hypothetical protein
MEVNGQLHAPATLPHLKKVNISQLHAMEAPRVVRGRGSHIS